VVQPTYWGGEVFAGYRVGRGDFQPWYQERQTNDSVANSKRVFRFLWRVTATLMRGALSSGKPDTARAWSEPDIQAQLISFVQDASYAYWDWVAAGEYHRIASSAF
jgi:hypothetical protein